MTLRGEDIRAAAVDWAVRLADPGFAQWDDFLAWLEADPIHASAYETVLAAAEAADPVFAAEPISAETAPLLAAASRPRIWRRQAAGGLLAAGIVGAIGFGYVNLRPAPFVVETGPGQHRTVVTDAATIALNGDTKLILDRHDRHVATLDRGEALFDVTHDAAHPFSIHVGGGEVQDIGTRFDVTRDVRGTRVAVAEGMVVYNPQIEAVRLGPGQTLDARDGGGELRVARAATADIGSWRENRLSYTQAPLSVVAADLSRGLGVPIAAAPEAAGQRFTGVIAYGGDRTRFLAGLGTLLDVDVRRDQGRWILIRKADVRF